MLVNFKRSNEHKPNYSHYDLQAEQNKLRQFLNAQSLEIHEDFFKGLRMGDVIDVYSIPPSLQQLYINEQFAKLCSYSKEDFENYQFPQLFWRPEDVQGRLITRIVEATSKVGPPLPYEIETHELVESLHPRKRTFDVNLGIVAPIWSKNDQSVVAFANTLLVTLIFEWPEDALKSG